MEQARNGNTEFEWPADPPIVIVGPTAVGKTDAAVELACMVNGEIINADSMQVYRGLDIGTAKPGTETRLRIPIHLLDIKTPDEPFSVSEWKARAEAAVHDIVSRGRKPIVCGGTGMYIRALLEDWTLAQTPAHPEIRNTLRAQLAEDGSTTLYARLKELDPLTAQRLHPNDGVRIVRALEVYLASGKPMSAFVAEDRATVPHRQARQWGLNVPRPILYSRIERRVDAMMSQGLVDEVRSLLEQGYDPNLSPLRSLGYKEVITYLQGQMDIETTTQTIKQNTRRYAKRQQTWFGADDNIVWLDVSAFSSAEIALELLKQQ